MCSVIRSAQSKEDIKANRDSNCLLDYYRLPADLFGGISPVPDSGLGKSGFFQFGAKNICYGRNRSGVAPDIANSGKFDASKDVRRDGRTIQLPFDPTEVIDNLRLERYQRNMVPARKPLFANKTVRRLYYLIRSCLPISIRRQLQRFDLRDWKELPFPAWPVDFTVDTLHEEFLRLCMETSGIKKVPFIWFWPEGAPACLIMTHDVETAAGRDFIPELIDLDASYGIRASYQVVPEGRYTIPDKSIQQIQARGCEFNVHDLSHDGQLYQKFEIFLEPARKSTNTSRNSTREAFAPPSCIAISIDTTLTSFPTICPCQKCCSSGAPAGRLLYGDALFCGNIWELPLTTTQDIRCYIS